MHLPFKYGIVSEVKPGYAKVFFKEDNVSTDWWPVLRRVSMTDKESWPLNIQEHVACVCDELMEEGIVLGAVHNDEDLPDPGAGPGKFRQVFEDGTMIEYDKSTHELMASVRGKATVTADGDISVVSQTKIQLTAPQIEAVGNLAVVGNLAFSGTLSGGDGGAVSFDGTTLKAPQVEAGTVELSTHIHSGVTFGGGTSGPPVP